jgi:hypothetical protein
MPLINEALFSPNLKQKMVYLKHPNQEELQAESLEYSAPAG